MHLETSTVWDKHDQKKTEKNQGQNHHTITGCLSIYILEYFQLYGWNQSKFLRQKSLDRPNQIFKPLGLSYIES